jgi:hypothetical protein
MCVWCKHAKVIYRQIHALHKKEDTRFKVFFTKFFYDNHLFAFHLLSSFSLIFLLRSDVCMRRFKKFVCLRHYKNELCAMLLDVAPLNIIHKCHTQVPVKKFFMSSKSETCYDILRNDNAIYNTKIFFAKLQEEC